MVENLSNYSVETVGQKAGHTMLSIYLKITLFLYKHRKIYIALNS